MTHIFESRSLTRTEGSGLGTAERQTGPTTTAGDLSAGRVLDAIPAGVYLTDPAGRLTYYNEAAAALWGRHPELGKAEWCGSWRLYTPGGAPMPHGECPMAIALKERRPLSGLEAIVERPDGSRVTLLVHPSPIFGDGGELIGGVNIFTDISNRTEAERATSLLASIVELSHDAIVSKDLDGIIVSWNQAAQRLFGYTADEAVGRSITMLIPPERLDEEPGILARVRRGERIEHYETVRRRKDGTLIDISITVSPVKDRSGRIVGASKIARDITERRRAQEQQKLLLNEMKHRVKNTLATAQAIASQSIKSASAEDRAEFNARLQALARAHDLLTPENWSRAPLADVIRTALEPFREKHDTRFVVGGAEGLWLDANKAALLAMGLHELATNAVKYGALSSDDGMVHVHWEAPTPRDTECSRVRVVWREKGGPPVTPPERKGFGSMLIERALHNELGSAAIYFAPEGVTCTLEIGV